MQHRAVADGNIEGILEQPAEMKERKSALGPNGTGIKGGSMSINELNEELKIYLWNKLDVLWTTGETLDDIAFATAHEVYTKRTTIYWWGSFKRWGMFVVFLYLFIQNFKNFYEDSKFMSLDPNAGTCSPVGKSWK